MYAAGGNVRNLKEIIIQNFNNKKGKLLYVSGELVSSNLHKELKDENFGIDRVINYEVEHNNNFDQKIYNFMVIFACVSGLIGVMFMTKVPNEKIYNFQTRCT